MEYFDYLVMMLDELFKMDASIITCENYLDIIVYNLKEIHFITFDKIVLESVVYFAIDYYFNFIMPRRSYHYIRHRLNYSI